MRRRDCWWQQSREQGPGQHRQAGRWTGRGREKVGGTGPDSEAAWLGRSFGQRRVCDSSVHQRRRYPDARVAGRVSGGRLLRCAYPVEPM
jgi:hypothetical protein